MKSGEAVLGLDFNELTVKFVEMKETPSGHSILNFGIKDIPKSEGGKKTAPEVISRAITDLLAEKKVRTKKVISSVAGAGVSIRRIIVPRLSGHDLTLAIKQEAKTHIPFPIETAAFDYAVLNHEKSGGSLDVMAVAALNELLDEDIRIIKAAGLEPAGITAAPFAYWDLVRRQNLCKEGEVIAVIDIGAEVTTINIFKSGVLQFTREVAIAGEAITRSMTGVLISDQWQMSLNYEEAVKIKHEFGIPQEGTTEKTAGGIELGHILEIIRPVLRQLSDEIARSFAYYRDYFQEAGVNKIYLGGGGAKLKGIVEYFTLSFGINTELLNILQGISFDPQLVDAIFLREAVPRLDLAINLATSRAQTINFRKEKRMSTFSLNLGLFPSSLQKVHIPQTGSIVTGIAILLLCLGYYTWVNQSLSYYQKEVDAKRAILNDLKNLSQRREIIRAIEGQRSDVRGIFFRLTELIPPGIALSSLNYDNASKKISIIGATPSQNQVGILLKKIEVSPNFKNVNLVAIKRAAGEDSQGMTFEMNFFVE